MTCGEGHNSIAKSLKQGFEKSEGTTCEIVQTYGFDEKRVEKENQRFLNTCKRIPHLYDMIWNIMRKRNPNKPSKIFDNEIKDCFPYFIENINRVKPDMIVCTHYYASAVVCRLQKENLIDQNILTVTVGFDFCLSPYWEFSTDVDYIISPMEAMQQELLARGYKENQIKPFGIPIRPQFSEACKNVETKQNDKFTVMMIAGGNGIGNTLKVVKGIAKHNDDINLIVVNGRNKKSFEQIEEFKKNANIEITNLGFVNNLEEYFAKSDVIVCRCGGCGMSEILTFKKPLIIREKMIINEKINKKMFIEKGCALGMKKSSDAGKLVKVLRENPALREKMSKACGDFAKPNATADIVDFLTKECENRKGQ